MQLKDKTKQNQQPTTTNQLKVLSVLWAQIRLYPYCSIALTLIHLLKVGEIQTL